MNIHKNARLTPYRREDLVTRAVRGEPVTDLARQFGVSIRTTRKWVARYRAEGPIGLQDRSSRPHVSPRATAPAIQLGIKVLRHQRWTCAQIAGAVGVSAATAARVVRRAGLSRRGRLDPPPLVHRYEHARPGDLLHLDTKKLGRIAGVGHRITGRWRDAPDAPGLRRRQGSRMIGRRTGAGPGRDCPAHSGCQRRRHSIPDPGGRAHAPRTGGRRSRPRARSTHATAGLKPAKPGRGIKQPNNSTGGEFRCSRCTRSSAPRPRVVMEPDLARPAPLE